MRQRNWRLIVVGGVLIVAAPLFFLFMLYDLAPRSNDPATRLVELKVEATVVPEKAGTK